LNPAMKQRLVGTLVLGSLALIVIPLMLDGEGVERPPLSGSIPPAPVFDTTPLPEPERPEILADTFTNTAIDTVAPAAAASALSDPPAEPETAEVEPAVVEPPAATVAVASTPEPPAQSISEPALDPAGLPETWVVRVGVFGEKANAERLAARLVADDYKAFVRPVGISSGVFVGPMATQNDATGIQQQLNDAKTQYQIGNVSVQRFDIAQ
jgi:DedD protein